MYKQIIQLLFIYRIHIEIHNTTENSYIQLNVYKIKGLNNYYKSDTECFKQIWRFEYPLLKNDGNESQVIKV